jgi:hypothetical protein
MQHSGDSMVVEKGCKLLQHSMKCTRRFFKPVVSGLAELLIIGFQQHHHSAYLYTAEILAETYLDDPEVVPILVHLFHSLSGSTFQILASNQGRLEETAELVEDFYGMFEKYLRHTPKAVLEAPMLQPALKLCSVAIHVQHKDAMLAIVAFIESVFGLVVSCNPAGSVEPNKMMQRQMLQPHVVQTSGELAISVFQMIGKVPTQSQQETIPRILGSIHAVVGNEEYQNLIKTNLRGLPPATITS